MQKAVTELFEIEFTIYMFMGLWQAEGVLFYNPQDAMLHHLRSAIEGKGHDPDGYSEEIDAAIRAIKVVPASSI